MLGDDVGEIAGAAQMRNQARVVDIADHPVEVGVDLDAQQPRVGRHCIQDRAGGAAVSRPEFHHGAGRSDAGGREDTALQEPGTGNDRADLQGMFYELEEKLEPAVVSGAPVRRHPAVDLLGHALTPRFGDEPHREMRHRGDPHARAGSGPRQPRGFPG